MFGKKTPKKTQITQIKKHRNIVYTIVFQSDLSSLSFGEGWGEEKSMSSVAKKLNRKW
jgi:hypothetical protein